MVNFEEFIHDISGGIKYKNNYDEQMENVIKNIIEYGKEKNNDQC